MNDLREQIEKRLDEAQTAHKECAAAEQRVLVSYQAGRIEAFEFTLRALDESDVETPIDLVLDRQPPKRVVGRRLVDGS